MGTVWLKYKRGKGKGMTHRKFWLFYSLLATCFFWGHDARGAGIEFFEAANVFDGGDIDEEMLENDCGDRISDINASRCGEDGQIDASQVCKKGNFEDYTNTGCSGNNRGSLYYLMAFNGDSICGTTPKGYLVYSCDKCDGTNPLIQPKTLGEICNMGENDWDHAENVVDVSVLLNNITNCADTESQDSNVKFCIKCEERSEIETINTSGMWESDTDTRVKRKIQQINTTNYVCGKRVGEIAITYNYDYACKKNTYCVSGCKENDDTELSCAKCPDNATCHDRDGHKESFKCNDGYAKTTSACIQCGLGEYYDDDTELCTVCKDGTYQDQAVNIKGEESCKPCPTYEDKDENGNVVSGTTGADIEDSLYYNDGNTKTSKYQCFVWGTKRDAKVTYTDDAGEYVLDADKCFYNDEGFGDWWSTLTTPTSGS